MTKKTNKDYLNRIHSEKYGINNASYSYKNIIQHGKKSPVQDEEIKIIGIRPAISITFSSIGRNIEFPQSQML